jgi:uncharacterized small protein (DUF1192 family)
MADKAPGRGQGANAVAGHEAGQNAAIDGLVAAVNELQERVASLENEADEAEVPAETPAEGGEV